jgi:hypothetical protein
MMAEKKQRNQIITLVVLLLVAGLVWRFSLDRPNAPSGGFAKGSETYTPINAQDFSSVFDGIKKTQSTEYKSSGRNIFVSQPLPSPPDPSKPTKTFIVYNQPQPPPPPPPAQLPWKFFGYGVLPVGGSRQAFLLDGEDVHIVGEGELVLNHIRITHIGNERIEFEDINTGQRGSNQMENTSPAA